MYFPITLAQILESMRLTLREVIQFGLYTCGMRPITMKGFRGAARHLIQMPQTAGSLSTLYLPNHCVRDLWLLPEARRMFRSVIFSTIDGYAVQSVRGVI